MCDVKKYNKYAKELMNLNFSDMRQLVLEADSEELRDYYMNIYNFLLKKKQQEILKEHLF